ncbi:Integrin beta5, partial [Operophtera brumata]
MTRGKDEHDECGPCLSAASHCRWCADPLVSTGCSQAMIQRPEKPIWEVTENKTLQDMQPDSEEAVVQIQPQKIKMPAKNYPVDLYYLMDLTWSMKDDKETLVSLRDDLPGLLKNLTDNFRLGFGSFAEKPIMPFISMDKGRRANPCTVEEVACEPTYAYKHHLSLTNKVNEFIEKVNSSSVTANLDNAEAQLDALMQVLTCGDKIGWSARSRKIVILSSDGLLHIAGDGRLAATYDYPSIAQIYRLLDKYKVNVIFAVTESVKDHYDSLHELLEDFTYVAKLESDSSNILKLVKTGYEDIVSVVDFEDDSHAGPVKVRYFTDCGVKGGSLIEATRCTGVEYGMTLNYEAHVSLDSCKEYKTTNELIRISESQLGQDSLSLDVELQCGCRCAGDLMRDMAMTCHAHSHLVCGVCQSGPSCDCSIENENDSAELMAQCREPNTTRTIACSGAGDCLCGKCECDRGYSGRYCQCKACEVSLTPAPALLPVQELVTACAASASARQCGGVGRGDCVCGQCSCANGWSGVACDCTDRTDTCTAPGSDAICSGNGDYQETGFKYSGMFCEACATCENPLCASAEPCVSCHLNTSCSDICTIGNVNYTVSENLKETELASTDDVTCILRVGEDALECEYKYTYTAVSQSTVAMDIVIRSRECYQPTSAKIMTSAFVIMACVVAAGIILILGIKSAQIVSDRRAYAKFLKEAEESRLHMQEINPLYISPISEFRMPDSHIYNTAEEILIVRYAQLLIQSNHPYKNTQEYKTQ